MAEYGYVRVSTEDQDLGTEAQKKAILDKTKIDEFFEERLSGATPLSKRPGLMDLIGRLRKDDKVWVMKRDRLARDAVEAGMIIRLIQKRGAHLFSADGIGNGDDPANILIAQVIDAFAQYERAMISLRTQAALAVKRENGEKLGGPVPYGYTAVDRGGVKYLVEDSTQQTTICDMQDMRDAGMSLALIAETLNRSKVSPPSGLRWYGKTVSRILQRAAGHTGE